LIVRVRGRSDESSSAFCQLRSPDDRIHAPSSHTSEIDSSKANEVAGLCIDPDADFLAKTPTHYIELSEAPRRLASNWIAEYISDYAFRVCLCRLDATDHALGDTLFQQRGPTRGRAFS
jgi:hypothetical protein